MNRPRSSSRERLCASTLLVLLVGCDGGSIQANPAPIVSTTPTTPIPPTDAGQDRVVVDVTSDTAEEVDTGPVIRSVHERSRFGPLDPLNLFHDGDFELSAPNSIQYPWFGLEPAMIRIGAACRSGLRCVSLEPDEFIFGTFVWPSEPQVEISFYGHMASDDCEAEGVGLLMAFDVQSAMPIRIGPMTESPVDGWCHYGGTFPTPGEPGHHFWGVLLATRSAATGPGIFDEASVRAVANGPSRTRALPVLGTNDRLLIEKARTKIEKLLPPNPPRRPKPITNMTGRRPRPHR